jgi:hypothetical protein
VSPVGLGDRWQLYVVRFAQNPRLRSSIRYHLVGDCLALERVPELFNAASVLVFGY